MARKTVEDLEDNQFITAHNAAKLAKYRKKNIPLSQYRKPQCPPMHKY